MNLTIDGIAVSVPAGTTILKAAEMAGIRIPTLCYIKDCAPVGACRICVVEVENMRGLPAACATAVREGMVVHTCSERVYQARKNTLDLICRNHRMECDFCPRYTNCELYALMTEYGLGERPYNRTWHEPQTDTSDCSLSIDSSKCIACRRCINACRTQGIDILALTGRGAEARMAPVMPLGESKCIHCGQCAAVCPVGAIYDTDKTNRIDIALRKHDKCTAAIVTNEAFMEIGKLMGMGTGYDGTKKLTGMLKKIGFTAVFAEGEGLALAAENVRKEYAAAKASGISLIVPGFGARQYIEKYEPELLAETASLNCSSHICEAELARTAVAERQKIDAKDVVTVLISTSTAARMYEGNEINIAVTVRELVNFLRRRCVSRYTMVNVWRTTEGVMPEGTIPEGTLFNLLGIEPACGIPAVQKALSERKAGEMVCISARPEGKPDGGAVQYVNKEKAV